MSEELERLKTLALAEIEAAEAELRGHRADVSAAMETIRESVVEAIATGDFEHVKKLVAHEVPTMLTLEGIEARGETRRRIQLLVVRVVGAVLTEAITRVAPVEEA